MILVSSAMVKNNFAFGIVCKGDENPLEFINSLILVDCKNKVDTLNKLNKVTEHLAKLPWEPGAQNHPVYWCWHGLRTAETRPNESWTIDSGRAYSESCNRALRVYERELKIIR